MMHLKKKKQEKKRTNQGHCSNQQPLSVNNVRWNEGHLVKPYREVLISADRQRYTRYSTLSGFLVWVWVKWQSCDRTSVTVYTKQTMEGVRDLWTLRPLTSWELVPWATRVLQTEEQTKGRGKHRELSEGTLLSAKLKKQPWHFST